ncbi:MAG: type II toxin-antitoxin system VapC family toxin [Meiothermus sp.]|nr:type II toxin-antitoxin system VapC family toxin [Meiothermus sp.]
MIYALDYSICIQLLAGDSPGLQERFLLQNARDYGVPAVVRAELLSAARRSNRAKDNQRVVENFLAPLVALPFDDASAEEYAALWNESGFDPRSLPLTDLMTAAVALAHRLTLVTSEGYSSFAQVPNLRVDWWRPE